MSAHTIFYYPYGDFRNKDIPLLKVAALYFDKLYILDPFKAVSGGDEFAQNADSQAIARDVNLLQGESVGILETVSPAEVLIKYDTEIAAAILHDLQDLEYIKLCGSSSQPRSWKLSLAKLPWEFRSDKALKRLIGDLPNRMIPHLEPYYQDFADKTRYEEMTSKPYIEHSIFEVKGKRVDYRYREFSLPLGESIMVNHALFGGLLHLAATPLTDDEFHYRVLDFKVNRASAVSALRQVLADRARLRQLKADVFAQAVLTDTELSLPILSPQIPLAEILEYRNRHKDELAQARERLAEMTQRIREQPWSDAFRDEIEYQLIPDVTNKLKECQKARDSWLHDKRVRQILSGLDIGLGAAIIAVPLFMATTPLLPVVVATAVLTLTKDVGLRSLEWLLDRSEGKKSMEENGFHYFLNLNKIK